MKLSQKNCVPCKGGVPPLRGEELAKLMSQISNNWQLNKAGHLEASFTFKTFRQALNFANQVGDIADMEGHHPDLYVSWGRCAIEIWTHKIQGLTESDFILAAKIDEIG